MQVYQSTGLSMSESQKYMLYDHFEVEIGQLWTKYATAIQWII